MQAPPPDTRLEDLLGRGGELPAVRGSGSEFTDGEEESDGGEAPRASKPREATARLRGTKERRSASSPSPTGRGANKNSKKFPWKPVLIASGVILGVVAIGVLIWFLSSKEDEQPREGPQRARSAAPPAADPAFERVPSHVTPLPASVRQPPRQRQPPFSFSGSPPARAVSRPSPPSPSPSTGSVTAFDFELPVDILPEEQGPASVAGLTLPEHIV